MTWNQRDGDKGPWGRRSASGNVDLDQKFRRWQRRLEALLRSAGQGEGGGMLLLALAIIGLALWLGSGLYQVGAAERGVIERFGRLVRVCGPGRGWHWPWPIETLRKVDVGRVSSKELAPRVLTSDLNLIGLRVGLQYRVAEPLQVLFQVRDAEDTLQQLGESAVREVIGQQTLQDALGASARDALGERIRKLIQDGLDRAHAGIAVTSVNVTDVEVPDPVTAAQRDAQDKAPEDAAHDVKEAQTYASTIIPQAQGYAAKSKEDALAYRARVVALAEGQAALFKQVAQAYVRAPEVTRERLYLETLEDIFARSSKVLVEQKPGAAGNMLYLPLDKLVGHGAVTPPVAPDAPPQEARPAPSESETVTVEGRGRGER
jgi:modulator of FtsH protease HflK